MMIEERKKMGTKKVDSKNAIHVIPQERIENKIYLIRGRKVMIDKDLAELYGVPTKRLKEQVRRNMRRFPEDFLIELTLEEAQSLISRSQIATLKHGRNIKYQPFAFTEQGVAMLSSVLNSDQAIEVNIQIMRAFAKLRELMMSHKDLARKMDDLERKFEEHDKNFTVVFEAIRRLLEEPKKPKNPIGFHANKA